MASKEAVAPFQGIFKVDILRAQRTVQPRPYTPRRPHRKSRGGCHACKEKRTKCDEARPACSKCAKSAAKCMYVDRPQIAPHQPVTLNASMNTMALDLVGNDLSLHLYGSTAQDSFANVRLLQHFQSVVSPTLGCSGVRHVMQSYVGSQAWSASYLMHMVLAISCAHQKRLSLPCDSDNMLSVMEASHWGQGLRLYREHLSDLSNGSVTINVDAVIATTFLSIMFTFALQDQIHINALTGCANDFDHTLEPLSATGGFRSLYYIYENILLSSKWAPVLFKADDHVGSFTDSSPGVDGIPRAFVHVCDLSATSTSENNQYHRILRGLTPLLRLEPSSENFPILFAFLGRTWPDFKPLVTKKDPRGLLLLSYWFALLRQVDQWWLTTRAKTECAAIVAYLSLIRDPSIDALLPFPAAFGVADTSYMWRLLGYVVDDSF